jgi:hypothetical protein
MKSKDNQDKSDSKLSEIEIHVHLAEYNALTSRCTTFTYILNVVLTLTVGWITTMIGFLVSQPDSWIISWGSILGAQLFGILFSVLVYEIYNMVRYLESHLRPLVKSLIEKENIWYYESFLMSQRKETYKIGEFSTVIIAGVIILIIAIMRIPWKLGDLLGFVLNLIALYIFTMKIYDGAKIRWNKWKID